MRPKITVREAIARRNKRQRVCIPRTMQKVEGSRSHAEETGQWLGAPDFRMNARRY